MTSPLHRRYKIADQLEFAIRDDDFETIQSIHIKDKFIKNKGGQTIAHHAVFYGKTYLLEWIITERKLPIILSHPNKGGDLPIHEATIAPYTIGHHALSLTHPIIKDDYVRNLELLCSHCDINSTNKDGNTPLHIAAETRNLQYVSIILQHNPDVNIQNNIGWTPLHYAALNGSNNIANKLIESSTDVNIQNNIGWTPLHYAALNGSNNITNKLIESNADINKRSNQGETPLFIAAKNNKRDIADTLITAGCDYTIPNNDGITPLECSRINKNLESNLLINSLIKYYEKNNE